VQTKGEKAAYLLVGSCQLLLQCGNSFQCCPEPLSHLSKLRGDGGRKGDPTRLRLEGPGLGLLLSVRESEGPPKGQIPRRELRRT
jgi:hypothetical protein